MPDIGLLQGPPRPRPPIEPIDLACAAGSPAGEIAAKFSVPMGSAISIAASATTPQPTISAPDPPRIPAMPLGAPAPIRGSDLFWLALALLVIVGTGLGIRDPWPADEPRFAAIARDMVHTGEWLFPRVGGDLYQDKPPLVFWMLAACYAVFGSIRWSFLLPSFLAAGGILFLIYDFGRRLVGREAGLSAAL